MRSLISFFAILLLISCSTDSNETSPAPISQYTLTTQVNPTIGGSVSPSTGTYADGTSVSLTASANADYSFKEWTGGATGTTNPISVTMNANKSITAVFELIDTDGDGVTDSMDDCPDTPDGEAVDDNGCSFDQTHTYVPDDNFEQALIDFGNDDVLDDYVLTANINTVTVLNIDSMNISDLTGIEDFDALESLSCGLNNITDIDLSNNANLLSLTIAINQLTSLDVTNNTALTHLNCNENQLTSLDLSNNTALRSLFVSDNSITSLDVTNNTVLELLWCAFNPLTNIDVTNNTALISLSVVNTELTSLDVTNNTALRFLNIQGNQLASIDLSNNVALEILWFANNSFTSLDVSNNTALIDLSGSNNLLTSLDVSNNTALTQLFLQNNQLTSLDVSNNSALTYLQCTTNPLTCIQVNQAQLDNIPLNWYKDNAAIYATTCN